MKVRLNHCDYIILLFAVLFIIVGTVTWIIFPEIYENEVQAVIPNVLCSNKFSRTCYSSRMRTKRIRNPRGCGRIHPCSTLCASSFSMLQILMKFCTKEPNQQFLKYEVPLSTTKWFLDLCLYIPRERREKIYAVVG